MEVLIGGDIVIQWQDVVRTFITVGVPALATGLWKIIRLLGKIYRSLETKVEHLDSQIKIIQEDVEKKHQENKIMAKEQGDIANKFIQTIGGPLNKIADTLSNRQREA